MTPAIQFDRPRIITNARHCDDPRVCCEACARDSLLAAGGGLTRNVPTAAPTPTHNEAETFDPTPPGRWGEPRAKGDGGPTVNARPAPTVNVDADGLEVFDVAPPGRWAENADREGKPTANGRDADESEFPANW